MGINWYDLENMGSVSISSFYRRICMTHHVKINLFVSKYRANKISVQYKNNY